MYFNKKLSRIISMCLGLIMTFIIVAASGNLTYAEKIAVDKTTTDFILVLDCSGSMENSDKNGLSISAAKSFIDSIPVENARVGIIAFGPQKAEFMDPNKAGKYASEKTRVRVAYPLTAITNEAKTEAKKAIDYVESFREPNEGYTTIGYSLQAALDMLKTSKTAKNKACIILMSDGRLNNVNGDSDMFRTTDSNKKSVNDSNVLKSSIAEFKANGWPVYGLELSFDKNEAPANAGEELKRNTGYYQMNRIPAETGGTKVTADTSEQVDKAFTDIFARFFGVTGDVSSTTIKNGVAKKEIEVADLTAEMNVKISGDMSKVESIELTDPSGNTKEYNKTEKSDSYIVNRDDDNYASIKLLQPESGTWKVAVRGSDGIEITFSAIPMREMNLELNSPWDAEEKLPKGRSIEFTANFAYNKNALTFEKVYKEYPATLEVISVKTGKVIESIDMTAAEDGYTGSYVFTDEGEYKVRAVVKSDVFRDKKKQSGSFKFTVYNPPITPLATIDDMELGVNKEASLDLTEYFDNPDNDALQYRVEVDEEAYLTAEVKGSSILLKSGEDVANVEVRLFVNDGSMKEDIEQTFAVKIINGPVKAKSSETITKTIAYNADKVPGFIKNMFGMESSVVLEGEKLFEDPDGTTPTYEIVDAEKSEIAVVSEDSEGKWTVTGADKGTMSFKIVAHDGNDEKTTAEKNVEIKSVGTMGFIWHKLHTQLIIVFIIIGVVAIILAASFLGRKIYGVWDVTVGGSSEDEVKLASYASGKKSQCRLSSLLYDLDLPSISNEQIKLKAGNKITKPVCIIGLESAEEVEYKGINYDQVEKKLKKAVIKKGQAIEVKVDGTWVVLSRY